MNAAVARKSIAEGPWHVDGPTIDDRFLKVKNSHGMIVCLVPKDSPTAENDAAMIAAAPDLQESSAAVMRWLEGKGAHLMPRSIERRVIYGNLRTRGKPP